MSNENALRAMVATKQLEIDKLKKRIKEMEDGQRNTEDRKKNTRSKQNNSSNK